MSQIIKVFKVQLFILVACTVSINIAMAQSIYRSPLRQGGFYSLRVGDAKITALTDGTIDIKLKDLLLNTSPKEIDSLSSINYQTATEEASVNAYLIEINGKRILVDAGTAELYGPTLGHLSESLKQIGLLPSQIDAVLITHIHTDHTGGLVNDGQIVFPNATIYVSQPEFDFWMTPGNKQKNSARLAHWFDEAQQKVGPYQKLGKIKTFNYGKQLFPGITPLPTPGHTPGHTFYALESKGQKIMFMGDIIHAAAVQFPKPTVTITFDVDPNAAAAQRIKAFQAAADGKYWVAADHISFPGIGHIRKDGKGFRWIPINFSTLGTGQ